MRHRMANFLIAFTTLPSALAQLAHGHLREKVPPLEQALASQFQAHQHFLVSQQLVYLDFLDGLIERVSTEIAERVRPFEGAVGLLDSILGIGRRIAGIFVAKVGVDLGRFPHCGSPGSLGRPRAG